MERVLNRFFRIRDFPCLKLGIRDFKEKSGPESGLKVCTGSGMPKITPGITGLHEIWVGISGSKNPIGDRLWNVPLTSFRMATNGGIA